MGNTTLAIREAARLLGVSTKTLRRWEERGLLSPQRTFGNQRRYSIVELESLKKIKSLPVNQPQEKLELTIQEAADFLHVSTKTLRRWEERGVVVPSRTAGNQRRYTKEQLKTPLPSSPKITTPTASPSVQSILGEIAKVSAFASLALVSLLGTLGNTSPKAAEVISQVEKTGGDVLGRIAAPTFISPQTSQFSENIIINSSFDGGNFNSTPTFWSNAGDATVGNTFVSNESIHTGTQAVKIYDQFVSNGNKIRPGLAQSGVSTINGRDYTLSVYVRVRNLIGTPALRLGFLGTVGTGDPNRRSSDFTSYGADIYKDFSIAKKDEWIRYSFNYDNAALGKYPFIQILDYEGGFIFLDDASLNETTFREETGTSLEFQGAPLTSDLPSFTQANMRIGDNTIIADANGNLYPAMDGRGSIGIPGTEFASLYLNHAYIDKDGNFSADGSAVIKDDLTVKGDVTVEGDTTFNNPVTFSSISGGNISISGTNPTLAFEDTSTGSDDWNINVDGNALVIRNTTDSANYFTLSGNGGLSLTQTLGVTGATTLSSTLGVSGATTLSSTLAVTGDTTFTGDLAVNGADVTSTATTFNLLNSTVTTLNIGGAATSISLGAGSGTFTVNNPTFNCTDCIDFDDITDTATLDAATTVQLAGFNFSFFGNGNVGIGTTAPAYELDVANYARLGRILIQGDATSTGFAAADTEATIVRTSGAGSTTPFNNAGSLVYRTRVSSTAGRSSHIFYTGSPSLERLRIDETGNVGIGTSSPQYNLQVVGTTNITGAATIDGNVSLGDSSSDTVAVNGRITTSVVPNLTASVDLGTTALRWNNIWAQTINTTGTNTSGQASFTYDPANTNYSEATVLINPTTADTNDTLLGIGVAGVEKAGIDAEGDLVVGYSSATAPLVSDPFSVYNHGTTRVAFIDTSGMGYFAGNVGVGTTAPVYKLEVLGSVGIDGDLNFVGGQSIVTTTGDLTLNAGGNTVTPDDFYANGAIKHNSAGAFQIIQQAASQRLDLGVDDSVDFTITTGGNVGIGMSSPGANLQVAGNTVIGFGPGNTPGPTNGLVVSGNVGVGTSSPNFKLEVVGSGHVTGNFTVDGTLTASSTVSFGSTVQLADGSNSSPSLSFTNDTNTGLYRIGSDKLGFVTGGLDRVMIDSNGNLGIGTTSPNTKLHIRSTPGSSANTVAIQDTGAGLNPLVVTSTDYGSVFGTQSSSSSFYAFAVYKGITPTNGSFSGGTEIFTVLANGNVGVGDATPDQEFDVNGDVLIGESTSDNKQLSLNQGSNSGNRLVYFGGVAPAGSNLSYIQMINGTTSQATTAQGALNINGMTYTANAASTITNVADVYLEGAGAKTGTGTITTASTLYIAAAPTAGATNYSIWSDSGTNRFDGETFLAMSTGNVGVGTSIPVSKMQIVADTNALTLTRTSTSLGGLLAFTDQVNTVKARLGVEVSIGNDFFIDDGTTRRFTIKNSDGNIGIGSLTVPVARLHIQGAGTGTGLSLLTTDSSGAQRFAVLDNGNVGIGTTNPSSNLEIASTSAPNAQVSYYNTATNNSASLTLFHSNSNTLGTLTRTVDGQMLGRVFFSGLDANLITRHGAAIEADQEGATSTTLPGRLMFLTSTSSTQLVERMRIDSTGNVGIGTAAPIAKFNLFGTGASTGVNFLTQSSAGTFGLAVLDNGNVGIGTTGPIARLMVEGNEAATQTNGLVYFNVTQATNYPVLKLQSIAGGNSTDTHGLLINNAGTGYALRINDDGTSTDSSPFIVDAGGNVGIGTTGPTAKLEVIGGTSLAGALTGSATSTLTLEGASSDSSGLVISQNNSTDTSSITNFYNGPLTFGTNNIERIRILAGGNVGIGTTAPATALEVVGTSRFTRTGVPSQYLELLATGGSALVRSVAGVPLELGVGGTHVQIDTNGNVGVGDASNLLSALHVFGTGTTTGLTFLTQNSARSNFGLAVLDNGNVGIGTTGPRSLLDVLGNGTANTSADAPGFINSVGASSPTNNPQLTLGSNDAMAANVGGTLTFQARYLSANTASANFAYIQGGKENSTTGNLQGYLSLDTRKSDGNFVEGLRINSSGNVGIGTASPIAKLEVTAADTGTNSTLILDGSRTDNKNQLLFRNSFWSTASDAYGMAYIRGVDSTSQGGHLDFATTANSSGTTGTPAIRMRIQQDGNVGIGTTAPAALLEVNKNQNEATELRIANSNAGGSSISQLRILNSTATNGVYLRTSNDLGAYLNNVENSYLAFGTNNTERMRISSTGDIGVSGTSNQVIGRTVQQTVTTLTLRSNFQNLPTDALDGKGGAHIILHAGANSGAANVGDIEYNTIADGAASGDHIFSTGGSTLTEKMRITRAGTTTLDVSGTVQLTIEGDSAGVDALCGSIALDGNVGDTENETILDCSGAPTADYMEMYPVAEDIEVGDIVAPSSTYAIDNDGKRVPILVKSTSAYQRSVIGIASDPNGAGDFNSIGYNIKDEDNPWPLALSGRVLVKIAPDSEPIQQGDSITSSNTPGRGMKATQPGQVVGKALENWTPGSDQDTILVFVTASYNDPTSVLANLSIDGNGNLFVDKNVFVNGKVSSIATQTSSFTILDEEGEVDIDIVNEGGRLFLKNNNGDATIAFDPETGNAYFTGTVVAKRIRAESIEGLDLSSLSSSVSAQQASSSAEVQQLLSNLDKLTERFTTEASSSSDLSLDTITAVENLTSIGQTLLGNTNIAGTLTVGTLFFDDTQDSINTISTLKLQNSSLSGAVELFAGKITLARNGDIQTSGIIEAAGVKTKELTITTTEEASPSASLSDATIGEAILEAGETSVTIETTKIKSSSKIFVTPTTLTSQTLVITEKSEGESFTVSITAPQTEDIDFDWWLVNTEPLSYGGL